MNNSANGPCSLAVFHLVPSCAFPGRRPTTGSRAPEPAVASQSLAEGSYPHLRSHLPSLFSEPNSKSPSQSGFFGRPHLHIFPMWETYFRSTLSSCRPLSRGASLHGILVHRRLDNPSRPSQRPRRRVSPVSFPQLMMPLLQGRGAPTHGTLPWTGCASLFVVYVFFAVRNAVPLFLVWVVLQTAWKRTRPFHHTDSPRSNGWSQSWTSPHHRLLTGDWSRPRSLHTVFPPLPAPEKLLTASAVRAWWSRSMSFAWRTTKAKRSTAGLERPTRIVGQHDILLVKKYPEVLLSATTTCNSVLSNTYFSAMLARGPSPSQTGVTVSVTVQISGSETDVWRSHERRRRGIWRILQNPPDKGPSTDRRRQLTRQQKRLRPRSKLTYRQSRWYQWLHQERTSWSHQDDEQFYVMFRTQPHNSVGSMEKLGDADGNDNAGSWEPFYVTLRTVPQPHDSSPCYFFPGPCSRPFPSDQPTTAGETFSVHFEWKWPIFASSISGKIKDITPFSWLRRHKIVHWFGNLHFFDPSHNICGKAWTRTYFGLEIRLPTLKCKKIRVYLEMQLRDLIPRLFNHTILRKSSFERADSSLKLRCKSWCSLRACMHAC